MPIPQEILDLMMINSTKIVAGFINAQTNLAFANGVHSQQINTGILAVVPALPLKVDPASAAGPAVLVRTASR